MCRRRRSRECRTARPVARAPQAADDARAELERARADAERERTTLQHAHEAQLAAIAEITSLITGPVFTPEGEVYQPPPGVDPETIQILGLAPDPTAAPDDFGVGGSKDWSGGSQALVPFNVNPADASGRGGYPPGVEVSEWSDPFSAGNAQGPGGGGGLVVDIDGEHSGLAAAVPSYSASEGGFRRFIKDATDIGWNAAVAGQVWGLVRAREGFSVNKADVSDLMRRGLLKVLEGTIDPALRARLREALVSWTRSHRPPGGRAATAATASTESPFPTTRWHASKSP
ncbi:hypothetical protein NE235_07745 [Actinoallomurus spadix]|uniref:Uncharacterized protein n=1 Tax=Actinoallomurus spadix TaxID=79912 RepID=A0ABP3FKK4_9ACTN|nr:hypothetical protein [Actinoallomurus spadix]MCO5985997.1 hypothetical protein [Actinoallomurus spadix]